MYSKPKGEVTLVFNCSCTYLPSRLNTRVTHTSSDSRSKLTNRMWPRFCHKNCS